MYFFQLIESSKENQENSEQHLDNEIINSNSPEMAINNSLVSDEGIILKMKEYYFNGFENIRKLSSLKNEDFIKSFDPRLNHKIFKNQLDTKSAGKSGKSIIMTHDKKFILKEIEMCEKRTL